MQALFQVFTLFIAQHCAAGNVGKPPPLSSGLDGKLELLDTVIVTPLISLAIHVFFARFFSILVRLKDPYYFEALVVIFSFSDVYIHSVALVNIRLTNQL